MAEPLYRALPIDPTRDTLPDEARVLHFFRHGEALHQVRQAEAKRQGAGCRCFDLGPAGPPPGYACPYWSEDLVDAPLTPLGREETAGRGATLGPVELVLTSPMTRTLESAQLAFGPPTPILALDELRPRVGRHQHSRGSPRTSLVERFPRVDFSCCGDAADRQWSPETEPREVLEDRAARFLAFALGLRERRMAVVTHFTVLLALLLSADETFTLGPSRRAPGTPALIDGSAFPDPRVLQVPVEVGEARTLVVAPGRPRLR